MSFKQLFPACLWLCPSVCQRYRLGSSFGCICCCLFLSLQAQKPSWAQGDFACLQWSLKNKTQIISHWENNPLVLRRIWSHIPHCQLFWPCSWPWICLSQGGTSLSHISSGEPQLSLKEKANCLPLCLYHTTLSKGDWVSLAGSPVQSLSDPPLQAIDWRWDSSGISSPSCKSLSLSTTPDQRRWTISPWRDGWDPKHPKFGPENICLEHQAQALMWKSWRLLFWWRTRGNYLIPSLGFFFFS